MIQPSYSLTATERVLPRLALDFTTASLDPRVTVTRSLDTATRVNSSGYIEMVNANLPRFDYDPVSQISKGLLIEESRANLLTYSSDYSNPIVWAPTPASSVSFSAGAPTSPDGTANTTKLIEYTNNGQHRIRRFNLPLFSTSTTYTYSFFVKQADTRNVEIFLFSTGSATIAGAKFDLSSGTVISTSAGTSSVVPFKDGWYRCIVTGTTNASAQGTCLVDLGITLADGTVSYTGNGSSGIYIWGAQLEIGSFATSYIPTTTTSLTRNSDVVGMTGTNFSNWWQATTGTLAVVAQQSTVSGTSTWVQFDDATADNLIALRGSTTNPELYIKATTDQAQIDAGTIAANTSYNLAGAWNTDSCAAALNAAAPVSDTAATIPTVTQARLGSDGTNYLNGWLRSVKYWPQRLIDAEVQAFSKL